MAMKYQARLFSGWFLWIPNSDGDDRAEADAVVQDELREAGDLRQEVRGRHGHHPQEVDLPQVRPHRSVFGFAFRQLETKMIVDAASRNHPRSLSHPGVMMGRMVFEVILVALAAALLGAAVMFVYVSRRAAAQSEQRLLEQGGDRRGAPGSGRQRRATGRARGSRAGDRRTRRGGRAHGRTSARAARSHRQPGPSAVQRRPVVEEGPDRRPPRPGPRRDALRAAPGSARW